jgi:hypothetical protein
MLVRSPRPENVMGAMLFLVFDNLSTAIPLGALRTIVPRLEL